MHRLLFLPTHWLSQSFMLLMTVVAPLVFLWTGVTPLVNVDNQSVLSYIVPMVLAVIGGMVVFAPGKYFPLAAQVLGTFQSFKILPTVLATLAKPFGHVFRVTPKGAGARQQSYERGIFWTATTLIVLTISGLLVNTIPEYQIVERTALLPMIAIWGGINIIVLFLVAMMSLQAPSRASAKKIFQLEEPIWPLVWPVRFSPAAPRTFRYPGVGIIADADKAPTAKVGERIRLDIAEVRVILDSLALCSG